MFTVTTGWYQQRTARGKTTTKQLSSETVECEWPDGVADVIAAFLENNRSIHFSGMEDFGTGDCAMYPESPRCRTHGDCRHHHIGSVRTWVEKRVDELKPGEEVDFHGGTLMWVSITVRATETDA